MPTAYPNGNDNFTVTSLPEDTPLSQAGPGAVRNHPELHTDEGDAIEALQVYAAQKTHDHSGDPADPKKGAKLSFVNTHEGVDTDSGVNAIHHTIGTGANQAAAGNHNHSYNNLLDRIIIPCTSTTRPASPAVAQMIWETNTQRAYAWTGTKWVFLYGAVEAVPGLQLRQSKAQRINDSGSYTIIEWSEEVSDNFNMFDKNASQTDIVIKQSGTYNVAVNIQWDPRYVPDRTFVVVTKNGVATEIRADQFMRGNLFTPGFSQTLTATGTLRNLAVGDVIRVGVGCNVSQGLIGLIFSFFDPDSRINSRFDLNFVGA